MLNNHVYNLLLQATRNIKACGASNSYKRTRTNAQNAPISGIRLEKDKEGHVVDLEAMIKKHL